MSTFLRCDALVRGSNEKIRDGSNHAQLQFYGGSMVFFLPLQERFAENANKSYHVCKVIVALHIYHNFFGIRYALPPANKIKIFALIKV